MGAQVDVVGIGNALVDVIARVDDDFLVAQALVKASMALVEPDRAEVLYAAMGPAVQVSGGSAANTMAGLASLGSRAAFVGRVTNDQLGTVFAHDIRAAGMAFDVVAHGEGPPRTLAHCGHPRRSTHHEHVAGCGQRTGTRGRRRGRGGPRTWVPQRRGPAIEPTSQRRVATTAPWGWPSAKRARHCQGA